MFSKKLFPLITLSFALVVGSTAVRAETNDDASFSGMFKMEMMDKNKDGMLSKAEFLAMMGKAWDMKAKEMKVKGGMMSDVDFKAFMGFLSRGEKNK
jgi:Ca2+-binding EF-hand superfamily protein